MQKFFDGHTTRQALLEATEREINKIVAATQRPRRPLKGEAPIGLRVGKVLHRFKMVKHFRLDIREACFSYARDWIRRAVERALPGCRTSSASFTTSTTG